MRSIYAILGALVIGLPAAVLVAAQGADDDPANALDAGQDIDLTPTALVAEPAEPSPGEAVLFTATIENGGANDSGAFNVSFFVDGAQLGANKSIADLPAGGDVDVASDAWNAAAGVHVIRVVVDPHGDVSETSEENNTREITLDIRPDLSVDDIAWSPGAPIEGDAATFTATLNNSGDAASGAFNVTFLVDGAQLAPDVTVAGLAPGATVDVASAPWNATPGAHVVRVVVDGADEIDESDEANNAREESVEVAGAFVDLVLADIVLEPAGPHEDDALTFRALVRNDGNVASAPFELQFTLDAADHGAAVEVGALAPAATVEVASIPWDAVEGMHTVGALADSAFENAEADEANNAREDQFAVGDVDLPDLEVDDLTLAPPAPDVGDDVTFTAAVTNDGEGDAGPFVVRFVLDGAELGTPKNVPALAAGASVDVASDVWDATAGAHTIVVLVDEGNAVAESDEDDNDASRTFTVAAPPPPPPPDDDEADGDHMTICHRPPGNPDNEHTITVGASAWHAHERHGDREGACGDDAGDEEHDDEDAKDDDEAEGHGRGRGHGHGHGHQASDEDDE